MGINPAAGPTSGNDLISTIADLETRVATLERILQFNNLADSGWQDITVFQNGFSGTGVQVRSIGNIVSMRGFVTGGTPGDVAFVLPLAFIPTAQLVKAVQEYGINADTWISIGIDGTIISSTASAWMCCEWFLE